ncbi:MAG: radical SAM protein [Candidatus Thorarchaeota archaeon]
MQGAKLVLFVTGLCTFHCWYCPLSSGRWQKDIVYANERPVHGDHDLIDEATLTDARGTGITGGDPLVRFDRTLHYAQLLKETFSDHHIHLYTASPLTHESLQKMKGLIDELRIHLIDFSHMESVKKALLHDFQVGVEIPMIPSRIEETASLIRCLKTMGIDFVNLNELEYADRNRAYLHRCGYQFDSDSCGVLGSEEAALTLAEEFPLVHYCSSSDKDSKQLKNRLIRRARHVKAPYEEIEEGLLVTGIILCQNSQEAQKIREKIFQLIDIPKNFISVTGTRLETHWAVVEETAQWVEATMGIEKRYPTHDHPLIEYIPIKELHSH